MEKSLIIKLGKVFLGLWQFLYKTEDFFIKQSFIKNFIKQSFQEDHSVRDFGKNNFFRYFSELSVRI